MSKLKFDYVVVGAGIVGSWTAKQLLKYGNVLLLEQGPIKSSNEFREPHTRGSSHGQSRMIRSCYAEPFFADMMPHAFRMWRQAEAETKEKLIQQTGLLCIADSPANKNLTDMIKNMKRHCPENLTQMNGSDLKSKYPKTLKYDENCGVFLDKSGGVLFASKAVKTIQQWFQKGGGLMWDGCRVTEIIPEENKVLVKTSKNDVVAKSVVVTSGPWTKELLSKLYQSLPLEPQLVKVYYWKEKEKGAYNASSGFPAIRGLGPPNIYSLPSLEYPGYMKVCIHAGEPCNPEERDKATVGKEKEDFLRKYIKEHFPLLETEPSIVETCMYTCTPDEVFLIDRLPGHTNIIIGSGFSGTGFKTAPVVGRLLSELAQGVDPFLDVTPYKFSRFLNPRNQW